MKVKRFSRSEIKITKPVIKFKSPSKEKEEETPQPIKDEDEEDYYED